VAFLTCATALALRGRRVAAVTAAAAALLPVAQVAPWYFGGGPEPGRNAGPPIKLLIANVYYGNRQYDRIQRLIASEDPDVVGLVEIGGDWIRNLGELRRRYPYHHEVPDERYIGLGLYSRLPLENLRVMRVHGSGTPTIAATLAAPGNDVELILVHLPAPLDAANVRRRNRQAAELARHVRSLGRPTVVAGDLNMTMWNRGYRPLERDAGLVNARAGRGVGPSWPAVRRLGVPIDHILATPAVKLSGFKVLDAIGSDHLPISASLELVALE
jgi:endonuclease/exonuclease/phosphatase (EEP) superfamily protein YafD